MAEQTQDDSLVESAKTLVAQLESGASKEAMETIASLHTKRDQVLFQEVGKLTRSLHESIKNFQIDTSDSSITEEMSRMQDASDRLNYVIDKTEVAANKTMDLVEETIPVSHHLGATASDLKDEWDRFLRREMEADEFRELSKKMVTFLGAITQDTGKIDTNLSEIMLAQDFQDLTGQIIKRVIQLVQEVEDNLVQLVSMAGAVDQITGLKHELPELDEDYNSRDIAAEGPILNADKRDDVVSGQDDVDALLSSLGF